MFDFSYERTLKSIDESLERLGIEYLDVIQIHDMEFCGNVKQIITQTLPAMQRAKELGKVRHIGLTGYPLKIHREIIAKCPPEIKISTCIIYCHYAMNDRTLEDFMPFLKENKIGLINASAVSMGLLTNRGPPVWHPAGP
jgi:aryl-alcohol dehydrogenase-like predicted oxidoreductase